MRWAALGCLLSFACAQTDVPRAQSRGAVEVVEGLQTPQLVAFTPSDDLRSSASIDGRWLAFTSDQNGNQDVWLRDFRTNSTYPLTLNSADDYDPFISADGKRLVFVSRRSDAKGDLFLASSFKPGAGVTALTDETTHDRQPVFSPSGEEIYFTAALGIGLEYINVLDVKTGAIERISPTPGFDPAVSHDGRYLVYTAPDLQSPYPRLVAMRLQDTATRTLTAAEAPEGFARFLASDALPFGVSHGLVYVRFPDDDNADGELDARDRASLWRLDLDLDRIFSGEASAPSPVPLTDGGDDELFPDPSGKLLYFTQGTQQQDILRLPVTGIFPDYADPSRYLELIKNIAEPRTRWFALRYLLAKTPKGSALHARGLLSVGNLHYAQGRTDLARRAFGALVKATRGAPGRSEQAELGGIAKAELTSLDRRARLRAASTPIDRERAMVTVQLRLESLAERYSWAPRVVARCDLELAELKVDRGQRVEAIEAFEAVVSKHKEQSFSSARAMLRRIELLKIAHDPDAISEAYLRVLQRYPDQREVVAEASRRIVDAYLNALRAQDDLRDRVDVLRRIMPQDPRSPVHREVRWRLAKLLQAQGALADAALELERLVAISQEDRLGAARALEALAKVNERAGHYEEALRSWRTLRQEYGELPGVASMAREAITRVNLRTAQTEEKKGHPKEARRAYHNVIDNDPTQVEAHRRYLALSQEVGALPEALDEAEARARRSPGTPMARYYLGLARTWKTPPDLEGALEEIEAAISINPQFTQAYITRGWIQEMAELEEPGLWDSFREGLFGILAKAVSGILDVQIGPEGRLVSAIEDYKTALRLNPESLDSKTEAEILLNLGNAHYRLGEKTKDLSNFKIAFERYLEMLKYGYEFQSPVTEMVFFERLGRTASWNEDWATSSMATRRAIKRAEALGLKPRLAQLYGNLALAYAQAGEDAYARVALERFGAQLKGSANEDTAHRARVVIAERELARAQLDAISGRSAQAIEGVLEELKRARVVLRSTPRTREDSQRPSLTLPLGEDVSSAQYGFSKDAEHDLNLALAERAHRVLGESGRANAIREARLPIAERALENIPGVALGVGRRDPLTLVMVRERTGLYMAQIEDRLRAGATAEAAALFEALIARLQSWMEEASLAQSLRALRRDRARVHARYTELLLARGTVSPNTAARLERALIELQPPEEAPEDASEALPEVPEALTTTVALARTASIAMSKPKLSLSIRKRQALRARLLLDRGLVTLASTDQSASEAAPPELSALLAQLDASQSNLQKARADFEEAARVAALGGPGLGTRVLALSLDALWEVEGGLLERGASYRASLAKLALRLASFGGDQGLATLFTLRYDPKAAPEALERTLPSALQTHADQVRRFFSKTASAALARNDVEAAVAAIDRGLLFQQAAGPIVELERPEDARLAARLREAQGALQISQKALADAAVSLEAGPYARLVERVAQRKAELIALVEEVQTAASPAGAARLLGAPQEVSALPYSLAPDEAMLIPAPIGGRLELLLVDGSTQTEARFARATSPDSLQRVQDNLSKLRSALSSNLTPELEQLQGLERALILPLAARLADKRKLLVVGASLGAPLPAIVAPQLSMTHLWAPSSLEIVRQAQMVGVEGTLAIAAEQGQPLIELSEGETRLSGEEAQDFRATHTQAELLPGQPQSLEERSPVERLAERAHAMVVLEAPIALEPAALERSAIELRTVAPGAADRFEHELPLVELDTPASVLVLGRILPRTAGGLTVPKDAVLRMDLALAPKGIATSIVVPADVPRSAARDVLERTRARMNELGIARSLSSAIGAVAERAPAALLISMVGSPGLDEAQMREFAQNNLKGAARRAVSAYKKRRFGAAISAIERWIRIQRLAGNERRVQFAYQGLVGILGDQVKPPRLAQAVDAQAAYVSYLKSRKKGAKRIADATVDLGLLYSRAHDFDRGEQIIQEGIAALKEHPKGRARALYQYARHKIEQLDYQGAAQAMERSIELFEKVGSYRKKKDRPREAERALRALGDLYLNRLSDPVNARRAYLRVRKLARTDGQRISNEIDLARVARRSGRFAEAAEHAASAQANAAKINLAELELSALIEAANVAWYQGDYRRGQALCEQSLTQANALLRSRDKKVRRRVPRRAAQRLKIYALSVCGLVAMSAGDLGRAESELQRARKLAIRIDDQREVATQYNNLGRAYLEFGRLQEAIRSFRAARQIDERFKDRYALAYDLRNLGRALALQGSAAEAKTTLEQALRFAVEVKDANNELRATFALAELARSGDARSRARSLYQRALPLAERLVVKELAWQIHRALGLMEKQEGRPNKAEKQLKKAVRIARSITGRAADGGYGVGRYQAFDDLVLLLVEQGRVSEAFRIADQARMLEQTGLLDDGRVRLASEDALGLWRRLRVSTTATAAESLRASLAQVAPSLARIMSPAAMEPRAPKGALVVMYRMTSEALIIFTIDAEALRVKTVPVTDRELFERVHEYAERMSHRADVQSAERALATLLLKPIEPEISRAQRLVFIPHRALRYVAFAALPFSAEARLIDRAQLSLALGPDAALAALERPAPSAGALPIWALGAAEARPGLLELPFAAKELEIIQEEYPKARLLKGRALTKRAFLERLQGTKGVLHFAGHAYLEAPQNRALDPLAGRLQTSDGDLSMLEVLSAQTEAELVVLSACSSMFFRRGDGSELLSLAQSFQLAGARRVLASTMHVNDLAAAMIMKRFYRASRKLSPPQALRAAQRVVREYYPHPAWWATFSILEGP